MANLTRAIDDARSRRLAALASFEAVAASSKSSSHEPWCRESLHERFKGRCSWTST
jgi:hypothetical protein